MQIINLKRSGLVKHVGTGLIGLALSLGANAMDGHQHQHQGKELQKEVCKEPACEKVIEKAPLQKATKDIKVAEPSCNKAQEKVKEVCQEPTSKTCEKAVEKAVQICAKQEATKTCDQTQGPAQKSCGKELQVDPCQQHLCPEQIFIRDNSQSSSSSSSSSDSSSSSSSSEEEQVKTVPYTPSCELQKDCSNFNWGDFSLYINESLFPKKSLSCVQNFCTTADHRHAKNFWIQDLQDVGHHVSRHSHGAKDWNGTQWTNFKWHGVGAHSLRVKKANWSHFVINGDMTDLNFKNSTLDTGLFYDSRLSKARFKNSTLRNITFYNVKFVKTKNMTKVKKGRRSTFNDSILDNVRFIDCDMGHTTFENVTFVGNTFFQNSALRFKRHFVGSKWVDADGKTYVLTDAVASELDRRHQTYVMKSRQSMSAAQVLQSMKQCQSFGK